MEAEAEDKISVRIEKEWDAVDKQCLRPLQVNQYCIVVGSYHHSIHTGQGIFVPGKVL